MAKPQKLVRHVALAYPITMPWMALFMRGVTDYADRHGGWAITTSPPTLTGAEEFALNVFSLRGWPGDGVIAAIGTRKEAEAARNLGIPVVNLAGAVEDAGLPRVMTDHYAIGHVAAEHLLERGFRRLAYCGTEGLYYSRQRAEGFASRANRAGVPCDVFNMPRPAQPHAAWQQRVAPLDNWLKSLRPPVGLLAVQDYRARVVVDECRRLGLDVPHDVAVLGVDNDSTVCEYCQPTISSVSRGAWRVGYETAALLDHLMAGKAPPPRDTLIPPEGVVARQSTDTVVVDEPHVAAAVHFIRDHLGEPFGIDRVVRHVSVSRRQLEMRFRRVLGCSPHEYLCRLRVERAKALLSGPDRVKMHSVAAACGFSSAERLRLVFRRLTGQTPGEYRRARRHGTTT